MVPRIIVDVDRHAAERGHFACERVEEVVVLTLAFEGFGGHLCVFACMGRGRTGGWIGGRGWGSCLPAGGSDRAGRLKYSEDGWVGDGLSGWRVRLRGRVGLLF